jgi:hypothetical protein
VNKFALLKGEYNMSVKVFNSLRKQLPSNISDELIQRVTDECLKG